jgi:hypothetical protein
MTCFGLGAIEHLLIWIVVVAAVFAIIQVLLGLVSPPADFAWAVAAAIGIVRINPVGGGNDRDHRGDFCAAGVRGAVAVRWRGWNVAE